MKKRSVFDVVDMTIGCVLVAVLGWFYGADLFIPRPKGQATYPQSQQQPVAAPVPAEVIAYPASYEEVAKACISICRGPGKSPIGSGFLIGVIRPSCTNVMLLTARHVADRCVQFAGNHSVTFVYHRENADSDQRKTFSGSGVYWGVAPNGADVAGVDVTQAFHSIRKDDVDLRYIPLVVKPQPFIAPEVVEGTFAVLRADFARYHLGIGTPVSVLGFATEIWNAIPGKKRQPLALRSGHIAIRNDMGIGGENRTSITLIECDCHSGYSGSPVFATFKVGAFEYPALIGILHSVIKGDLVPMNTVVDNPSNESVILPSGFCSVGPLDDILNGLVPYPETPPQPEAVSDKQ